MKRHRFDPFSFLFGALFLVVGGTFLFGGSGLEVARPERMWAAAMAVVGVSLAVWAVARVTRREPSVAVVGDPGPAEAGSPVADDVDLGSTTLPSDEDSGESDAP